MLSAPMLFKSFKVTVGINDHQVNIQRFLGVFFNRLYHRETKDILGTNIPSIISTCIQSASLFYHFNIALQVGKICS
jgi:hypothetical protein